MNVFAKFYEIPSMILQDIKETKRYGHTDGRKDGQRENGIPSHVFARFDAIPSMTLQDIEETCTYKSH